MQYLTQTYATVCHPPLGACRLSPTHLTSLQACGCQGHPQCHHLHTIIHYVITQSKLTKNRQPFSIHCTMTPTLLSYKLLLYYTSFLLITHKNKVYMCLALCNKHWSNMTNLCFWQFHTRGPPPKKKMSIAYFCTNPRQPQQHQHYPTPPRFGLIFKITPGVLAPPFDRILAPPS